MKVKLKQTLAYLVSFAVCLPILFIGTSPVLAAGPIADPANLNVSGASGNLVGGKQAFIVGDTVIATYDASDLANEIAVLFDFSEFGGTQLVGNDVNGDGSIWSYGYQIANGSIDTATADIKVRILGAEPGDWVSDNEDHIVDNVAPNVSGAGLIGIEDKSNSFSTSSKPAIGDTLKFEAGTLADATGDSVTYEADLTSATGAKVVAGNVSNPVIEGSLNGSNKFPVSAVDDAGNAYGGVLWTNSKTFDTVRPTIVSAKTVTTNAIEVEFSEAIYGSSIDVSDFEISNPLRTISNVDKLGVTNPQKIRLETTSAFAGGVMPTVKVVDDGDDKLFDIAGNLIVLPTEKTATDGVLPQVGPDVEDLIFIEGNNDRDENLAITFSEAIPTIGSVADYSVIYDADGDFSDSADQRGVAVSSVSNPDSNKIVDLQIADQSGDLDYGGRFRVVVNSSNVLDASGNAVDSYANTATSAQISFFDNYAPELLDAGIDPSSGIYGVGDSITVFVATDDSGNDQHLTSISGALNGNTLNFVYDSADNRYEAVYVIAEGDADATNVEAIGIRLCDRAGNLSNILNTSGNSLSVDGNTPASPIVLEPITSEIINADNRTISGTAEAGSAVSVYTDPNNDGDKSDGVVVGSGVATGGAFAVSVPLVQDAENNFLVSSTDLAGNESASSDVATITEDSIVPVVNVNFPNGGELFGAGSSSLITWTASDVNLSSSPIDLYYSIDNGLNYSVIATGEINDGTYDWSVPDANSGQVLVRVVASDLAGNSGEDISDAVFAIDNSEPTSIISSDLQGQVYGPNNWNLSPINGAISGTADDSPSGVASVSLTIINPFGDYWNGSGWTASTASVVTSGTTAWSYTLDKDQMGSKDGIYTLAARATDNVGHVESTSTGSFVWDSQSPTASINKPDTDTKWRQGSRNITWSASDDNFPTQPIKLEYRLGCGSWNTIVESTENDGSYSWNISSGANTNEAQVRLTATDSAGNVTELQSTVFTIDSTRPNVSIVTPVSGSSVKGLLNLSAEASDPTPPANPTGIRYVSFSYRLVGTAEWSALSQITSAPYDYSWDTKSVDDGLYEIKAIAVDQSGNKRKSASPYTQIVIDNTAPSKPVASPPAGDYMSSRDVQLTSSDNFTANANIKIYYTTDGTDPDELSTLYSSPIAVDADTTIKAIAYDEPGNASEISLITYGIAPKITNEMSSEVSTTSATITWTTDRPATSRVVYDTVSHSTLGTAPNYGYTNSTVEDDTMVTSHCVTITGLTAGTTYYFRTVSHGSPEAVSAEKALSTVMLTMPSSAQTATTTTTSTSSTDSDEGEIVLASRDEVTMPQSTPTVRAETTATPEETVTPEVKGAQTEEVSDGESWWPLLIPAIAVLLFGAIIPLSAASAIAVPIAGAAIALIVAGYSAGDLRASSMYLILGAETIALLILNYYLLGNKSKEEAEEQIVETRIVEKVEKKPAKSEQKAKNNKNKKKKRK